MHDFYTIASGTEDIAEGPVSNDEIREFEERLSVLSRRAFPPHGLLDLSQIPSSASHSDTWPMALLPLSRTWQR